ncbi:MAG: hypothetical protein JSW41_03985 [Candidatus Aenigmatarchaeota archaeon]|nr:MAG: hypothetical protein JSW41_03985 [Candidatus Aenigmarchaeota archaeon]
MKTATIRISVTSPVKPDLVFSMLYAKIMKEYDKALQGKKTKLDADIAIAMNRGNIIVEGDVDRRIIYYRMTGTEDEVDRWCRMTLKERIVTKGIKKLINIEVVK